MHGETKRTAIPASVKAAVARRDCSGGRPATCIICGAPGGPWCHVVRRSQGGRGDTERNIVTLCNECHYSFDEGLFLGRLEPLGFHSRQDVKDYIYRYMEGQYPGWTPESVQYHKFSGEQECKKYDKRHNKYKKIRNASIYEAWVALNGKTGRAACTSAGVYLAKRFGVSRQRIHEIIKTEQKRRENHIQGGQSC